MVNLFMNKSQRLSRVIWDKGHGNGIGAYDIFFPCPTLALQQQSTTINNQ